MVGRSRITADDGERAAWRVLARSSHRAEADHARAVLLTLENQCAAEIAAVLGVHVSAAREWRGLFAKGGVAALKRRRPPGRPNRIGAAAGALAEAILAEDVGHGHGWTLPRLRAGIERRGGPAISDGRPSIPLRRRGSAGAGRGMRRRTARTPRPSPPAVAASRRRLAEPRRQAAMGAIDLLFLDESEARAHPYPAHRPPGPPSRPWSLAGPDRARRARWARRGPGLAHRGAGPGQAACDAWVL